MTKPQNLIIFLGENHTRHVTGAHGHPLVQTPNIDRIAREGALFSNAYCTSPICCPARASIATGRYPHQIGYWENSLAYDGRVSTWMHRLRDQGHEVAAVGKLHFRSTEDDNGFTEEIIPMHIVDGVGGLVGLLRGSDEEPIRSGNWEMYAVDLGPGETSYHAYDRRITAGAIEWLQRHRAASDKPLVLCVHYGSAHPPFKVPERLLDLYPPDDVPLPVLWARDERPRHPALEHLRQILGLQKDIDEETLRRMTAGYFGLITHLDEQVGEVIRAAEELGLLDSTRLLYTADHGDCIGNHYIFGKFNMYERAIGVPFVMSGADIASGTQVDQITSHTDLFPTILEAVGAKPEPEDADLMGNSLWPALAGREAERTGFAEYHALGSRNASYVLRRGDWKLVYHVDMPNQLFDLGNDPDETADLIETDLGRRIAPTLEAELRAILDPEATDARAKADQRARASEMGGREAILARGGFPRTPTPGEETSFTPVIGRESDAGSPAS